MTSESLVHNTPHRNMTYRDVSEENCRFSRDMGAVCFVSSRVSFSRVDVLTRIDELTGASEMPSNYANKQTRLFWITFFTNRPSYNVRLCWWDRQTAKLALCYLRLWKTSGFFTYHQVYNKKLQQFQSTTVLLKM